MVNNISADKVKEAFIKKFLAFSHTLTVAQEAQMWGTMGEASGILDVLVSTYAEIFDISYDEASEHLHHN